MTPSRPPLRLRLEIASIASGGEGIAHVTSDGERRTIFVPRSAPGDVLEAEVDMSVRPARGAILRVFEPSPLRAPLVCEFAERCGGCDLMHLTREAQRDTHRLIAEQALARAVSGPLPEISFHASPSGEGYRTRARFAVIAGKGRAGVGYRRARLRRVEDIERCIVLEPRLSATLPLFRQLFAQQAGEGEVAVALGREGKPVVDVRWQGELDGTFFGGLSRLVDAGTWAGAEVWLPGVRQPARLGDPRALTIGADGEPLVVPAGSFAQAHTSMNEPLGRRVLALADLEPPRAVVELFAGSGNFTVLIARHTDVLTAVEADARAAAATRDNLAARGVRARVIEGDADAFELPAATRTVVLDPPRAGAVGAVRHLAASKVRRVVYVSCDVTTLARDVTTLASRGFRLTHVEMFEMFPHTSHVEIVACLERPNGAARGGNA